jgi:repressor LexA
LGLSLTSRQGEILEAIEELTQRNGYPPSIRELSDRCGLGGPSGAHRMVSTLQRKGFVGRSPGTSRGLSVLNPAFDCTKLDQGDIIRLLTVAELHRLFSNIELWAAAGSRSPEVREAIISDALKRTRRHRALAEMLDKQVGGPPDVSPHIVPVSGVVLTDRHRWDNFLVDEWVFNRAFSELCGQVAEQNPVQRAVLWPDIRIGRAVTAGAQKWLDEAVAEGSASYRRCRRRAWHVVQGIGDMLESIDSAYGRGELSVEFEAEQSRLLAPFEVNGSVCSIVQDEDRDVACV